MTIDFNKIICPECNSNNVYRQEETEEDNTEGQLAMWGAGFWGVFVCRDCNNTWYEEG